MSASLENMNGEEGSIPEGFAPQAEDPQVNENIFDEIKTSERESLIPSIVDFAFERGVLLNKERALAVFDGGGEPGEIKVIVEFFAENPKEWRVVAIMESNNSFLDPTQPPTPFSRILEEAHDRRVSM